MRGAGTHVLFRSLDSKSRSKTLRSRTWWEAAMSSSPFDSKASIITNNLSPSMFASFLTEYSPGVRLTRWDVGCRYEPEMFSGLMYRLVEPKVVLLIFVRCVKLCCSLCAPWLDFSSQLTSLGHYSGKVIITGAKTRQQIYEAFEAIYPVLTEYRKT